MFNHNALKLARALYGWTLDEIAEKINTSRQYVHTLENGKKTPTNEQIAVFCTLFGVKRGFFYPNNFVHLEIDESEVHFRKLRTTKQALKTQTISRLRLVTDIVTILENELNLPKINFPLANRQETGFSRREIEYIAMKCREVWGLGLNPIPNMIRVAENNGAFVLNLDNTAVDIDALSIFQNRPVILRNTAKQITCRKRFDIAHEIGHFILHRFMVTGDVQTEQEANMFASAFLLPEKVMLTEFPKTKNGRIDWQAVSEFKLKWKVSKAACFYRAHKLGLLTDSQYKNAVITLRQRGEAIHEREDEFIPDESPEMIEKAIELLDGVNLIANELCVESSTVYKILGMPELQIILENNTISVPEPVLPKILKLPKKHVA